MVGDIRKHLVALTGAGISKESGLNTFRDSGGLWEGYRPEEVATPEAWKRDPEMVLRFYNERREQVRRAKPNKAHYLLAKLEEHFDVTVITQNIDNLHEKAGSSRVIHLHGEILKARSTEDASLIVDLGEKNIELGDLCPKGSQLRPHVVWFGEEVPEMQRAVTEVARSDIFVIIGTSLVVYPAASLIGYVRYGTSVYLIDPNPPANIEIKGEIIKAPATVGMENLYKKLIQST
ncbi:MAG: NAD-dependent deacylase [Candidatus Dadabacteria bacterium]|nr:MAG: NAD-dependent deacylase [Candidatus Dadabacteria bacterium]